MSRSMPPSSAAAPVPIAPAIGAVLGRWRAARESLLRSQRFQRWASTFPLTRRIAARRARALFDVCAGFVYSQVLFACVRLRLLDVLGEGPQTLRELADRMALPEEGARRLLDAAASLKLVERRGPGRYGLGPLGAAMAANPGIAAMVEHHGVLYADLMDPVALLRGERGATGLSRYWPYAAAAQPARLSAADVAGYSDLMAASQQLVADDILDAYPLQGHRCLLDVGGGDGSFACSAAARTPHLRVMLFDLPAVAERARLRFEQRQLEERAAAIGGDFLRDRLPLGADVVSLVRVVHDHGDPAVLELLRNVRRALPERGTLLIAEPMAGVPGAEPMADAYFGFYLLAMGSGRARTPEALERLLTQAGFSRVRVARTRRPLQTGLLVAQP